MILKKKKRTVVIKIIWEVISWIVGRWKIIFSSIVWKSIEDIFMSFLDYLFLEETIQVNPYLQLMILLFSNEDLKMDNSIPSLFTTAIHCAIILWNCSRFHTPFELITTSYHFDCKGDNTLAVLHWCDLREHILGPANQFYGLTVSLKEMKN